METRVANRNDVQAASAVQRALIPDGHPYEYAQNILCTDTANLVAVHNGAVVGFISVLLGGLNPNGHNLWERLRPYLAFVGVLPGLQRQCIGTDLIRCALQIRSPHATSGMWVECPESAAQFYEKIGFTRVAPDAVQQYAGMFPKGLVYWLATSGRLGS